MCYGDVDYGTDGYCRSWLEDSFEQQWREEQQHIEEEGD
jgi:hypothetical protein